MTTAVPAPARTGDHVDPEHAGRRHRRPHGGVGGVPPFAETRDDVARVRHLAATRYAGVRSR